jgi:Gpi18-like mannosyltransferase
MLNNLKNKFLKHLFYKEKNLYLKTAFLYAICVFLFLKTISSLVMLIGLVQHNSVIPVFDAANKYLMALENNGLFSKIFLAPWYRWDTVHYLEIAEFGYDYDIINTVWPPLYPFFIKLLTFVVRSSLVAALTVSGLFSISGFILLFVLVDDLFDQKTAKDTLFFLMIYPASFFFIAGYSESIFLTLSLAVIILSRKKKWMIAGIACALATLTRVQGILLIVPIIIELILDYKTRKDKKYFLLGSLSLLYAPFVYGIFSLYVFYGLRADWPWKTLSIYWNQHFAFPWEGLIGTAGILLGKINVIDITPDIVKISSLVFSIGSIFLLIKIAKKLPLSISVYSGLMMVIIFGKVDENSAPVSLIRYLVTVFPIFISQALFISKKYLRLLVFSLSISLQIIFIVYFYWWFFVA